jgi:hypothetical protein
LLLRTYRIELLQDRLVIRKFDNTVLAVMICRFPHCKGGEHRWRAKAEGKGGGQMQRIKAEDKCRG